MNLGWASKKCTFTPTADVEDAANVISLSSAYTDVAGNPGTAATSGNCPRCARFSSVPVPSSRLISLVPSQIRLMRESR